MSPARIPEDFGGLVGYWLDGAAYLVRYGHGRAIEGVALSPLNLLQAHKTLGGLIEQGEQEGHIADEHFLQSAEMPASWGTENIREREDVDAIVEESTKDVIHRGEMLVLPALGLSFRPSAQGLTVTHPNGKTVTLNAAMIDALIRVAGCAWEAMGL